MLKTFALIAVFAALPGGCIFASVTGPHTCKKDIQLSISGRYGLYETCFDRFGAADNPKFIRYVDHFVDPVTGEVF